MQNSTFFSQTNLQSILKNQYPLAKLISVLLIFFIFLKSEKVSAQYAGQQQFQIYSPNTYSLGQYGDIPVNLSLGIPQINVPIIKFSDKDINLDVSLSYHASGIKVDEEASWVGLGWALNAGGVITREVRGLPDGYTYWGLQNRTSIPDYNYTDYNSPLPNSAENYARQIKQNLRDGALNLTDNGSDIFYYNFNGRAGKFFLDGVANATLTQYEDFKIQFVSGGVTSGLDASGDFIITDERGFVYEFKAHETTSYLLNSYRTYIRAWYLSKITSPSGGELNFEYTQGGIVSVLNQKRCYSEAYFAISYNNPIHYLPTQYTIPCITHDTDINGIVLKKITSSSGNSLEFITSPTTRLDSDSGFNNQLDFIILKNNKNEQVKKFRFNYGYFEANNSKKLTYVGYPNTFSPLNYRLRLDSFREIAVDGSEQSPYRFEYYGDNDPLTDDPYTLPYRLSPCQDHWGYYNNSNNQTIFPSNPQNRSFRIDTWASKVVSGTYLGGGINFAYGINNGGTREPDTEATKACALNKIIFPTGGYTHFEFETHSINYENYNFQWPIAGGLRVKQIETKEGSNSTAIIKNYEYPEYMSSEKCSFGSDNPYYTYYSTGYNSSRPDLEGDWKGLLPFGVPAYLSVNNTFIVRAQGAPQLKLGAGTNAIYTAVKEFSPGNGSSIYNFSFAPDVEFGGDWVYEGVSLPGLMYSALVQTNFIAWFNPTFQTRSISSCTFPFPNFLNNDWRRGHLLSKETYSENGVLMSRDSTIYDIRALKAVPGYKVAEFGDEIQYIYARYYDIGGMAKPIRQVTNTYNSDGSSYVRTVKELEYGSPYHKQLTESREYDSKGGVISTKYYYPTDYGSSLSSLNDRHILAPVDVRSYRNSKLISGEQVQYGVNGLPLTIYKAEKTGTDIAFNPQSPYTFSSKLSNTYNANNILSSQTITKGITYVYLWGYKEEYPVAKVENSTLLAVEATLTATELSNIKNGTYDQVTMMNVLNKIRTTLSNAIVTTYTYSPLVGMTSITDPKGYTTYYEYDNFNRLQYIKDQDSNILQKYCYNYLGQQTDCSSTGSNPVTVFTNTAKSTSFTKQSCGGGAVGTSHVYSVPGGIYSSTVSQADADSKAVNEIAANGQNFANANGTCTFSSASITGNFTKNNCDAGGVGQVVSYMLAAGSKTSTLSQADANAQATTLFNTNGQANANANGTCTFSSASLTGNFTKNNCASGGTGQVLSYTLVAGSKTSIVSQADANAQATTLFNANGQANANTNGTCTFSSANLTGNFTKNNCAAGGAGQVLSYTLAAGSKTSTVSQADANAQAATLFNTNGQANANTNGICTFSSAGLTGNFTKNNCASGGTGQVLSYTLAAGSKTSTLSQADANTQAATLFNTNGQANANANGTCTFSSASLTGNFTKNNCASGGTGQVLSYTLAAGSKTSIVSQADADAQAATLFNTSGQANANTNGNCTFYNIAKSGSFVKSCAVNYAGSTVVYNVSAGTYSSTSSQLDADNLVQNDVNANGQNYANTNGTCTLLLPAVPSGLAFSSATASTINFTWGAVSGATSYKIYRDGVYVSTVTNTIGSLSGLASATTYNVQVLANNTTGDSALCTSVSMLTVPAVPTGLTFTSATAPLLNCSWTGVSGAAGYKIYVNGSFWATSYTPTITIGGLTSGTTYNIQVLAYNASGDGVLSSSVSMTFLAGPTGLTFSSATPSSINFSWNAVGGATGYKIYKNGMYVNTVTTTTGSLSGLIASTAYNIQVLAITASAESNLCPSVSMSTTAMVTGFYKITGTYPTIAGSTLNGTIVNRLLTPIYVYAIMQFTTLAAAGGSGSVTINGVTLTVTGSFVPNTPSPISANYVMIAAGTTVTGTGSYQGSAGTNMILAYSTSPGGSKNYWPDSN